MDSVIEPSVEAKLAPAKSLLSEYKYFIWWTGGFLIVSLIFGGIYLTVQQGLRQGANDPQIQLASDISAELAGGASPTEFDSVNKTDISKSIAPFLMIFGSDGKLLASTGKLDGADMAVPKGSLDYAKSHRDNRVTWQPKVGVRNALVIVPFKGTQEGFVAVGRSLREVEKRETFTFEAVALLWLVSMIIFSLLIIYSKVAASLK